MTGPAASVMPRLRSYVLDHSGRAGARDRRRSGRRLPLAQSGAYSANVEHFVVSVIDATSATIYVDGSLLTTVTASVPPPTTPTPLHLGCHNDDEPQRDDVDLVALLVLALHLVEAAAAVGARLVDVIELVLDLDDRQYIEGIVNAALAAAACAGPAPDASGDAPNIEAHASPVA